MHKEDNVEQQLSLCDMSVSFRAVLGYSLVASEGAFISRITGESEMDLN